MPGLGEMISSFFGSENKFKAKEASVDPNAYEYGGRPGMADQDAQRYQLDATRYGTRAYDARSREGAQADYAGANRWENASADARAGQASLANAMAARASGAMPSIAEMQAGQQMQQVQAAQAAQAASARGAAGVALAQQNAAANTANAQSNIGAQAQINAANERMQAEQAASGAYGQLRGGDVASQAQSAQQSQFNAGLQQQQRGLNDQFELGMTQAELSAKQGEQGVRGMQMTGGMNREAQRSANFNAAQNINAGVAGQNAQQAQANGMGALSGIASVASMAAMSDPRAKTGVADLVTSTWGTGKGKQPWETQIEQRDAAANALESRSRAPMSGGMAVPGFSPGMRMSAAQPLIQRDEEEVMLAKAKQNEGIELSEEEARKAGGAQSRLSSLKKAGGKPAFGGGASGAFSSIGESLGKQAASIDTSLRVPQAYAAPQLLQVSGPMQSGIEMKTGLAPLYNPRTMTSDNRAKLAEVWELGRQAGAKGAASVEESTSSTPKEFVAPSGPSPLPMPDNPKDRPKRMSYDFGGQKRDREDPGAPARGKPSNERRMVSFERGDPAEVARGGRTPEEWATDDTVRRLTGVARYSAPIAADKISYTMGSDGRPVALPPGTPDQRPVDTNPIRYHLGDISDERTKIQTPLSDAARSMRGASYEYRPEFTPPDQAPGERNVGPMANEMAKDPVASNIVKRDPSIDLPGGGLVLDQGKMVKTLGAIAADLQQQNDDQQKQIATLASRLRGRKK